MPSLRALEEFKSSFDALGGELQIMESLNTPHDDLPLPDSEPAPVPKRYDESEDQFQEASLESVPIGIEELAPSGGQQDGGSDFMDFGDLGDLLGGGADSPVPDDNLDWDSDSDNLSGASGKEESLGDFIDSIPDDFSSQDTPPGLLDGFADEIEAEREAEAPSLEDFEEMQDISGPSFDTEPGDGKELEFPDAEEPLEEGAFPDFDLANSLELQGEDPFSPVEGASESDLDAAPVKQAAPAETAVPAVPDAEVEDFSIPEELPEELASEEDFDVGADQEFSGMDLGEFAEADAGEEPGAGTEDIDFGEMQDLDFAEPVDSAPAADEPAEQAGDDDNFDLGRDALDFDSDAILEEIPGDSFDNFNMDSSSLAGNFDIKHEDEFGGDFGDDFSIPGLDREPGKKPAARDVSGEPGDEVEEINLTEEDLEQLQNTLSSYPLNLRIACEEIIAEMAVPPDKLSRLLELLITGASARETAVLAGQIMDRTITIPKGFEKKTGESLEAEQSSFAYIFVHKFLPVFRLFLMIALVALSAGYLCWKFIYTPIKAQKIYNLGIDRIQAGEYGRANERFREAYKYYQNKSWFYKYARAFRDERQYTLAQEKYQELLYFTASKNKRRIPEKKAVLEYADLETNYIGDYESADRILRRNILDFNPLDKDALLALGDNALIWGEYESAHFEDAREAYARYMERYGRSDPILERMLKYFIRTDNLEEVLYLQDHFMSSAKRIISSLTLAELGGYLLDKRYEEVKGVPNVYLDSIGGIRDILLRAISQDRMLPESYYQLARYYNYFGNSHEEKLTLDLAVRVFEIAKEETPKRIKFHINTLRRYSEVLVAAREFFPAEESLIKAVKLYQDGLSRRLLSRSPEFGRLYADLGDMEYFIKEGNWQKALEYYRLSEQSGWAPPEIQYRMGAAHYQLREWAPALDRLFTAYREMPPNRRILFALGNVSYMRGNYFAAQGYYDRLLEILEADRSRLPKIMATDDENELELAERLMVAQNNLGVVLDALTERTGNNRYRSRAHGFYADSERAWDILTRNPKTMMRMRPSSEINAPGINPAFLNIQNSLRPVPGYEAKFFLRIDKDILEPSPWEELAPPGFRLSEGIYTGR